MNPTHPYIAIKITGLTHWLWFERFKTTREDAIFTGKDGWGEDGAATDISVSENCIEGTITSHALQY